MRASAVVKRQSTRIPSRLRCVCHAPPLASRRFGPGCGGPGIAGSLPRFQFQPCPANSHAWECNGPPTVRRCAALRQVRIPRTARVVHHQHNSVLVRVVLVHQLLDHPCPIGFRAPVRHFHPAPPFQRSEQHEKVAHPVALVFIIVGARRPRPGRTRPAHLFHPRSWPRAGSVACWSRPGRPELRCPHTGADRLPARLPSHRQTRRCLAAGCTSIPSAKACPVAERGLDSFF